MSVEDWRRKIDEIDRKLVALLNDRSECVVEIGRIKKSNGSPLYQPDRESQVLAGVERANRGPLSGVAVRRLFEHILEEARNVEQTVMRDEAKKAGKRPSGKHRAGSATRKTRGRRGAGKRA